MCSAHDCQVCVSHSSILTCKIPRTEEPSGLQSMRLQRGRHNLATKQLCTCAHVCTRLCVCACAYAPMHMCAHVSFHIYVCVCEFTCKCVCASAWGHVCEVCVCVCIHGRRSAKCQPWRHSLRISCDSIGQAQGII